MIFRWHAYRFGFVSRASVYFPPGKAGNVLRGALGLQFRAVACDAQCPGARECPSCPYARLFEPHLEAGPSGLADPPRPFVLRADHLDGLTLAAGERFDVFVHVFDLREPAVAFFALAFARLAESGLGPGRGSVELTDVDAGGVALFREGRFLDAAHPVASQVDLGAAEPAQSVTLEITTPMELKERGALVERPEFGVLFARLRDRVANLQSLYGGGGVDGVDFSGLAERARAVRLTRAELRQAEFERRSSRTGQRHPLGGFLGWVEYQGALGEFVPWLRVGEATGVGRQTVWGKGAIRVASLAGVSSAL